jgi:hypothetical protein
MPNLRSTLNDLAHSFASNVLSAIRSASIQDLLAETGAAPRRGPGRPRLASGHTSGKRQHEPIAMPQPSRSPSPSPKMKSGRLARRTPADVARTLGLVIAAVKAKPMRAEEIGKFLKLDKRELPRVLKEGLRSKKLKSRGQKRATTYSVA